MLKCRTYKGHKRLEYQNSIGEYQPVDCDSLAEMWAVAFAMKDYCKVLGKPVLTRPRTTDPVRSLVQDVHAIPGPKAKTFTVWIEEVRI